MIIDVRPVFNEIRQDVSELNIDLRAGEAIEDVTVIFSEDLRDGELIADVISYLSPCDQE